MNRVLALTLTAALGAILCGCKDEPPKQAVAPKDTPPARVVSNKPKVTKLEVKDTKPGTGKHVVGQGDAVYVLYEGKLANDKVFDGSERHDGEPLRFVVGNHEVTPGFEKSVLGMKVGGERDVAIPSAEGYGSKGSGDIIPPDSDLYFHIVLVDMVAKGDDTAVDITDIKKGTGAVASSGHKVTIQYTGKFINGKMFDSTRERGKPYTFTLGHQEVVPGFDAGIQGMKVGGIRKIHINPGAGYGGAEVPNIPANSILIFEVELVDVK